MKLALLLVGTAAFSPRVYAGDVHVPGDYPTIQEAVDAALPGDTVLVGPGTYPESIIVNTPLDLRSIMGPKATVIDGEYSRCGVRLNASGTLDGFTITRCVSPDVGGYAVMVMGSSADVRNNIIRDNKFHSVWALGGAGIYCQSATTIIENNSFVGNETQGNGGGIHCPPNGSAIIRNNILVGNRADMDGGGIYVPAGCQAEIANNTMVWNSAFNGRGGGISVDASGTANIRNSILWDNHAGHGGFPAHAAGQLTISYSVVEGGSTWIYVQGSGALAWGVGNTDSDPLFIDGYRLQQDPPQAGVVNPCVDTGDPASPLVAGSTRTDRVQDTGVVDMGFHDAIPLATATLRNAGSNPASYTAVTLPELGGIYTGEVDLATTGHALAMLAAYYAPATFPLGGNMVLVDIAHPAGELLGFPIQSGSLATFSFGIPPDPGFGGMQVYTQAIHVGAVFPYVLSNAQDLNVGF